MRREASGGRRKWLAAVGLGIVVLLVGGRIWTFAVVDQWWADAMGVGSTHRTIARLRRGLTIAAFLTAAVWFLGNLWLVGRSVASVRVPRRVGDLEIVQAVSRRVVTIAAVGLGLGLAFAMSLDAGDWWYLRSMAARGSDVGVTEPILGRDVSYYLYALPWQRTVHLYASLLVTVAAGVVAILYAATGAIRIVNRRLAIDGPARRHLGMLLVLAAGMLVWRYRLAPAEYVGGVRGVPFDAVLVQVRLPTTRVLAAIAAVVALASAAWVGGIRVAVPLSAWVALGLASLVGHTMIPAVATGARTDLPPGLPEADAPRRILRAMAYGIDLGPDTALAPPGDRDPPALLWDDDAARPWLAPAAPPWRRPGPLGIAMYASEAGPAVPVTIGVAEPDVDAVARTESDLDWARRHGGDVAQLGPVFAMRTDRTQPDGRPAYLWDLSRPEASSPVRAPLRIGTPWFGAQRAEFAIVGAGWGAGERVVGVRAGNGLRRLALAWRLQSVRLLWSSAVNDSSRLLWRRAVPDRLSAVAPFATFGPARPVVVEGTLQWVAPGYVAASSFPLTPRTPWVRGDVGYLRWGLVGFVDASTGRVLVASLPHPDPVTRTLRRLAPTVIRAWTDLPPTLRRAVSYPERVLRWQAAAAASPLAPSDSGSRGESGRSVIRTWVVPGGHGHLGAGAAVEKRPDDAPPTLALLATGHVHHDTVYAVAARPRGPEALAGPALAAARMEAVRDPGQGVRPGPIKRLTHDGQGLWYRSTYGGDHGKNRRALIGLTVDGGAGVASAGSFDLAVTRAMAQARLARSHREWDELSRWFEHLDRARNAGDWIGFERAYEELRRRLGSEDSLAGTAPPRSPVPRR